MKAIAPLLTALTAAASTVGAQDQPFAYPSVGAVLEALRADPAARFEREAGYIVVASRERDTPELWYFTAEGHPAHPSVVKQTVSEQNGIGLIDLAALCHVPQDACDRLLQEFRQRNDLAARARDVLPEQLLLDIGISLNDHERVRVSRLAAEEGKAAEIRMDDVLKIVFVPRVDDRRGVMLWTSIYEFDGTDYVLLSEPKLAALREGQAEIELGSEAGNTFRFVVTPLLATR